MAKPAANPPKASTSLAKSTESLVSFVPIPAIRGTRPLTIFCTAENNSSSSW
ncbi:Dihydrodipicolinate synthase [Streptococcus parauberis KRS-02083]|uniref:Dihydrodipicolinate synthase n=1 Tax=Streptococcus parauberis KRS-02083 TaxID=1207545 RepID=A0ABN0ISL6_9STRE|nr:Dihydrodipicolinate synthase [Streptococcus parauberis KRS-02083]